MRQAMSAAGIALNLLGLSIPAAAWSGTYQLICENPGREYLVRYTEGDRNIQVEATGTSALYRILAVEKTGEKHVIVAQTPNDGPTARLGLRPYLRMEFWTGDQLYQTDACRLN